MNRSRKPTRSSNHLLSAAAKAPFAPNRSRSGGNGLKARRSSSGATTVPKTGYKVCRNGTTRHSAVKPRNAQDRLRCQCRAATAQAPRNVDLGVARMSGKPNIHPFAFRSFAIFCAIGGPSLHAAALASLNRHCQYAPVCAPGRTSTMDLCSGGSAFYAAQKSRSETEGMSMANAEPKLLLPVLRPFYDAAIPLSWLIVRFAVGWNLLVHGWGKIMAGPTEAYLKGYSDLGFIPPAPWFWSSTTVETTAGVCTHPRPVHPLLRRGGRDREGY